MMDNSMYAVSQYSSTYIYDDKGKEIHKSQDMKNSKFLKYLQNHFLLAGIVKKI
jgi:hypothetical protein